MIVTLLVTRGADGGKTFRLLDGDTKVIGRSARSDIILQDVGISRQHCRVRVSESGVSIRDMNSKNGTAVNGQRIRSETVLTDGDLIEVGRSLLKVRLEPALAAEIVEEEPSPDQPALQIEAPLVDVNHEASGREKEEAAPQLRLMGAFEQYLEEPTAERKPLGSGEGEPRLAIQPIKDEAPPVQPDRLIEKVIAGCRVEALAGEDEISHIYRGVQLSMERPISLKVLLPSMTHDSIAVDRFIQTARAGGKLSHPNIVQVFDAGEEGGLYFIALELVDGKCVRELLRERGRNRPLDPAQTVGIISQVVEALEYAHSQSLLHRNITPDNILVTKHGIAKLAEIGFAKSLEDSGLRKPTRPGEQLDALYFSAPEVLQNPKAASDLSDIYSLGSVMFLMLSGHPPFRGASEMQIMEKVRQGRHESLQKLQRSVPDEIVRIVDRAMAAHPRKRYQNASELQQGLRRARDHLHY